MSDHTIQEIAPAKINLGLSVLEKRDDGFHEIKSVMHTINLCDELYLSPNRGGIHLEVNGAWAPGGPADLTYRGAQLMEPFFPNGTGVDLKLVKRIPSGAGLGGGSSDAAAAILGINRLFSLNFTNEKLASLAATIGSDIPFFIYKGSALCEGRGEIITPIKNAKTYDFLLVYPSIGTNTGTVYTQLQKTRKHLNILKKSLTNADIDIKIILNTLKECGQFTKEILRNDLELPALEAYPELRAAKEKLENILETQVVMTGSGSTLYLPCDSESIAHRLQVISAREFPHTFAVKSHL